MPARFRGAILAAPLLLLVACGGSAPTTAVNPTANDPHGTGGGTSTSNVATWDPTTGNIPLPNVLVTAAVTSPVTPSAHVPLTPDVALAWLNQQEAGNTNAVSGVNAPIYLSFTGIVDPATVSPSTVKVFQVLPDNPASPSSTETNLLGFRDVSAQFTYQVLPTVAGVSAGTELYLMPKVPMLPASRYLYVITTGVKDQATGLSVGRALPFGFTLSQTPLVDGSGHSVTGVLSDAQAQQLEQVRANVTSGSTVVFSGYAKTAADLVASAAADASGKASAGAGPTGISSLNQIAVLGRTITTSTGFTKPDPFAIYGSTSGATTAPLETLMYAWANNAAPYFNTAASRAWTNGVTNFQIIGSSAVPSGAGSVSAIFGSIPHSAVGMVAWGAFQSADIQMDPATVEANLAVAGGKEDGVTGVYNPGTSTVPGSNTLMQFRDNTGVLRGWYHQTRTVPFVLIVPTTSSATAWPVVIFQHGISRSKEDALAMANSACASGYAVIAIDQAVHGYGANGTTDAAGTTISGSLTPPGVAGMGNNRPQAEWASNFFMLPSSLTARANIYDSAFNLWRLERILNEPSADPTSLTAQLAAATANPGAFPFSAQASLNTTPGSQKFVGQSLGSIVGTMFLAGNAGTTGGSNLPGFLSVPGGRLAFILHDSPSFKASVDAGLAAAGIPTGSPTYNKFFVLAQSVADSADPASVLGPLPGPVVRFKDRLAVQEAVGDTVIPNSNGNYWGNALGGRQPQFVLTDPSNGFTQVLNSGQSAPAVPFMYGASYATFKAAVAPASGAATTPKQGMYQYGTTASPASHGLLLQDQLNPANTVAAQTQMARWLVTGLITDGAAAYPIMPPPAGPELFGPENLRVEFPR